jgi:hypothetical protein
VLDKVITLNYFKLFVGFNGGKMQIFVTRREGLKKLVEMIEKERFQW